MRSELITILQSLPDVEVLITWEGQENCIDIDNIYVTQGYILLDADRNFYKQWYINGENIVRPNR